MAHPMPYGPAGAAFVALSEIGPRSGRRRWAILRRPMSITPGATDREWPITVVARWRDPGFSIGDSAFYVVVAVGLVWLTCVPALFGGRVDPRGPIVALLVAAIMGGRWARRQPADLELELGPERLRIRTRSANAFAEALDRADAGALFAAESGLDWHERFVFMTDSAGRYLPRIRARFAAVEFVDQEAATDAWWKATMPAGTSREAPPAILPVTGLLGAWWPNSESRASIRGEANVQRQWKEGELVSLPAWERRQRRFSGAMLLVVMAVPLGLAILGSTTWTLADLVTVGPLLLGGLAAGLWLLLR